MSTEARPSIHLLAAEETSPSVLYGLYDVLYSVGAVYPDMTVGMPGPEALDVRIVAADAEPFRCIGNVVVEPHEMLSEADAPSAVVVCDMYTPIHASPKERYGREVAWLRRMHEKGSLICSVCSGSLLLAEAGLLDGRHAAAHWAYRDLYKRHYPHVRLLGDQMLCLSEEADGIVTAGGVMAWHDLAIYLVARYCGQRQALQTAKVFLIADHAEGQLPYAAMTRPQTSDDGAIGACLLDRRELRDDLPGRADDRAVGPEPAHLLAPVPRRHRLCAYGVRSGAAHRGGQADPRNRPARHRRGRCCGWLRRPRLLPSDVQAPRGPDARELPQKVPADRGVHRRTRESCIAVRPSCNSRRRFSAGSDWRQPTIWQIGAISAKG